MRDELYEYVISGLKNRKGSWSAIADRTAISTKTMQRMVKGEANPTRETLQTLAQDFTANPVSSPPTSSSLQ